MPNIACGTTTERVLRNGALLLLVTGYAAYSLYDGYIAYPAQNIKTVFKDRLGVPMPAGPSLIRPTLAPSSIATIKPGMSMLEATKILGGAGWTHENHSYFFGHGGFVELQRAGSRVQRATWTAGPAHGPVDLQMQISIGWILSAVALVLLIRWVGILRTRAVLSDEGLALCGKRLIPFDQITALSQGKHSDVVMLSYHQGGKSRTVALDRYVYKLQPRIVEAICLKTGLPPPSKRQDR